MTQPTLIGPRAVGARDELDRYYTPLALARLIVARRLREPDLRRGCDALEPSAGGGSFTLCLREAGARVTAVDVDETAPALRLAHVRAEVADFLTWTPSQSFDLIIGNPPFSAIPEHIARALALRPRVLSMILPLDRLGRGSMQHLYGRTGDMHLTSVEIIHPRPWPAHVRETACCTWTRTVSDTPAVIGEPLIWR